MKKLPNWLINRAIAHRGLHSLEAGIPENSLASFSEAIALGFAIEIDIQLIQDDVIIVFHDENTQRLTGVDKNSYALKPEELAHLTLLESDQTIPTLQQTLDHINTQAPLLIEIKTDGEVGRLEPILLSMLSRYKGEYAIISFDPQVIRWFKIHAPHIYCGQLSWSYQGENMPWYKKFMLRNMLTNFIFKPDFVGIDVNYLSSFSAWFWSKMGVPVLTWTVRSQKQEFQARKKAVNIIFEDYLPESHNDE